MTLTLLVYSLLQRKIRLLLEAKKETVPDQKGKATKKPTLNRINQCFEGIEVITHKTGKKTKYVFVRLDAFAQKVLHLLGNDYISRYSEKMLV